MLHPAAQSRPGNITKNLIHFQNEIFVSPSRTNKEPFKYVADSASEGGGGTKI